eukprot:4851807-Amphidinium_carterae.1
MAVVSFVRLGFAILATRRRVKPTWLRLAMACYRRYRAVFPPEHLDITEEQLWGLQSLTATK